MSAEHRPWNSIRVVGLNVVAEDKVIRNYKAFWSDCVVKVVDE